MMIQSFSGFDNSVFCCPTVVTVRFIIIRPHRPHYVLRCGLLLPIE